MTAITSGTNGDLTLYAKWKPLNLRISFDANLSGIEEVEGVPAKLTGKTASQTMIFGMTKALNKNSFKLSGYTFMGWNLDPVQPLSAYATEEEIQKAVLFTDKEKIRILKYQKELTLYAVWKKNLYQIDYKNVTDKEIEEFELDTEYSITDKINLIKLEQVGSVFLGWHTDKGCKKPVSEIASGSTGNKVLYAKWQENTF